MARYNLEFTTENGLPVLASPKILRERSIHILFTARLGGFSPAPYDSLNLAYHVGDAKTNVTKNRRRLTDALGLKASRFTTCGQVHGNEAKLIDEHDAGSGWEPQSFAVAHTDALITRLKDTPIAVFTADCVPVILADVKRKKVSVVHAGWKGIYSLIVPRTLALFVDAAQRGMGDVAAFIGPAIGPCCYEVEESRAALFYRKYVDRTSGGPRLDLPSVVRDQLISSGVEPDGITDSGMCTCCREDLFFSFRRDGETGRQAAIASILD